MPKPKFPCSKTCADRKAGCHSAECPHGWLDYEKKLMEYHHENEIEMKVAAYQTERVLESRRKKNLKKGEVK